MSKLIWSISPDFIIIPAHAWTPWFAIFGSKSGFNSIEECFDDLTPNIVAIETGLSSDPPMNWRLSALDNITLISNSDAHSPANLGREANVFEIPENELSYQEIRRIIKEKDQKRFLYTIEFFPEEGKYHYDGHRDCQINFSPAESKKNKGICPVCKKTLVIGVLNRVDQLADRELGTKPTNIIPFKSLVPLQEIIAEVLDVAKTSKKVQQKYDEIVAAGGSEFEILLDKDYDEIKKIASPEIALGIKNLREQKVEAVAGYDGVFGVVKVFGKNKIKRPTQKSLL